MKIVNQLSRAVPDTTVKTAAADNGQVSFQGTFAAVIGATAAAAGKVGDSKPVNSQNVEGKKTSSSESKKATSSSDQREATTPPQVAGEVVQPNPVTVLVAQVVIPQLSEVSGAAQNAVTDSQPRIDQGTILSGSESQAVTAGQSAVQPITSGAGSNGTIVGPTASMQLAPLTQSQSDLVQAPPGVQVDPTSASKAQSVTSVDAMPSTQALQAPIVASQSGAVSLANAQPAPSEDLSASQVSSVASRFGLMSTKDAVSTQSVTSKGKPSASDAGPTRTSGDNSNQQAAPGVSSESLKAVIPAAQVAAKDIAAAPANPFDGSTLAQSAPAAHVAGPAASAQPHVAAAVPTGSQSASPTTSEVSDATAATPATPATAATLAQQVTATSLAVSQQPVMQSASIPVKSDAVSAFNRSTGKSAAPGVSSQGPVISKGRAGSTDSRSSGTSDTSGDKTSSTDAGSGSFTSQVVAPDAGAKDVVSNAKGPVDSAALAQSTQVAPVAVAANSTPAHSTSPQEAGAATNTPLPAQTSSTDNTQAAHALSSAQLIQSAHGSEMRLGMQSAEFGNISINTSLNRQALSAQISFDHSALGHALAAHLPAIAEKLGSAYGVQAKVELRDTGSNSSLNDSGNKESKGDRRSQGGNNGTSAGGTQGPIGALTGSNFTSTSSTATATSSRLDIRI